MAIKSYLNEMDKIRDSVDIGVDEMLKSVDVKVLMSSPANALRIIILTFIKRNSKLFNVARSEGEKLGKSLK